MKSARSTSTGMMSATVPTMRPMLQMHEPTALPSAMPESPIHEAVADTTISGAVVAKLTSVPPMTKRGILSARPIWMLESTNRSPPFATRANPTAISRMSVSTVDSGEATCGTTGMRFNPAAG